MTEAKRRHPKSGSLTVFRVISQMKRPVSSAVRNTPRLESRAPCLKTGFVSCIDVSKPAENRMMTIAKCPMDSASS